MNDQQRTQVYNNALADAQSELDEMLSEFNALASRKQQLEHVMSMLKPLLDAVQPASAAPAKQEFAPLTPRNFQPPAYSEPQPQVQVQAPAPPQVQFQESVQGRIQDQSQFQELVPAQNFAEAAPAPEFKEELPAFAEVSQPEEHQIVFQREAPAAQSKGAASNDRLEDRINFALNFALLS